MNIVFNCKYFEFHKDYCDNIENELKARGHASIISTDEAEYPDADFTIQPDEACIRQGGKGIWINHAFPFVPHNKFYLGEEFKNTLKLNSDYIFTFSEEWKNNHSIYEIETFVVGMPKLDLLFNRNPVMSTILYAPTWNKDLTSLGSVDQQKLKKYGEVIFRGHPAFYNNKVSYKDAIKKASIVISDYSSVGLEAIVLNIPTILFESPKWKSVRTNHISNKAMEAAICVSNQKELEQAVQTYILNPEHLQAERLKYSKLLCEHQGQSSKIFVDTLERLYV